MVSRGLIDPAKKSVVLKEMPNNVSYIPFKSTTGMWREVIAPHNPDAVLNTLQDLTYDPYQTEYYDCEDRAFWGLAHIRSKFPAIPAAVAIGIAVDSPFTGQPHAVIAFWTFKNNKYEVNFYDPEVKNSDRAKVGDLVKFDTKMVVSYPVYRPNFGFGHQEELPPFEKFVYTNGAMVLDRNYDLIDPESSKKIMDYLGNKRYGDSPTPDDPNLMGLFHTHRENIIEDRVLWAWVNARREFKRRAIGMAFGTTALDRFDYAVLVLWNEAGKPHLFDIDSGLVNPKNFTVRTVIV